MNFDEWWGEDYDDTDNPFKLDSFKYWAYAGWYGHAEQNQFHPDWDTVEPFLQRIAYLEKQGTKCAGCNRQASYGYALYCAWCSQSQHEWVGLTDDEVAEAVGSPLDEVYMADFRKVEAKLKEKNT